MVSNWDELTLCGAKVTNTNIYRRAELSQATDGENLMIIMQLLEDGAKYGAEVNMVDLYGRTLLSWGAQAGSQLIVRILIERGAKVNLGGRNGLRPLDAVVEFGHGDEATIVGKILKKNGAK
ncbi:hypothetical protein FQN50_003609 [Emmonsiellopsis sp. PD_5]|nr:hypothetical protein FQN50_003609 [Emmonsiellopsis sp. PD_5]